MEHIVKACGNSSNKVCKAGSGSTSVGTKAKTIKASNQGMCKHVQSAVSCCNTPSDAPTKITVHQDKIGFTIAEFKVAHAATLRPVLTNRARHD